MTKPNPISIPLTNKEITKILSNVKFNPATNCNEWTGRRDKRGYGHIDINQKQFLVHRLIYLLYYGVNPGELFVCHHCDNPPCVTKEHLFLGTHKDNMADMKRKRRGAIGDKSNSRKHPERLARGERHGTKTHPERISRGKQHGLKTRPENKLIGEKANSSKLKGYQIREIRRLKSIGLMQREIAKLFGVGETCIHMIIYRKTWKHID